MAISNEILNQLGVVVIGRNEGDRLAQCLDAVLEQVPATHRVVYVDSGSTDQSCALAQSRDITVLPLDPGLSFTAARARNTGFQWLCDQFPTLESVQFIDGDCELIAGWLERAIDTLKQNPQLAVVCGRRRERFRNASVYNRLADMEWNTPIGEANACGGDALMRVQALQQVRGYDPRLICGEEPEMCIRLRRQGWRIERLDAEMTLHDAAMLRFSQWWRRSIRGGWAVAEGFDRYGRPPENYMVREQLSGLLWGGVIPLLSLGLAWPTYGFSLLLLAGYPVLMGRIYRYRRHAYRDSALDARWYAFFCVLSKLPQLIGQIQYFWVRWRGRSATLIEYKSR